MSDGAAMELSGLSQYGAIGICLAVFIYLYLATDKRNSDRQDKMQEAADKRESALRIELAANRAECRADSDRLIQRIESLETDRSVLLMSVARSLEMNAAAFKEFSEAETGKYEVKK